MSINDACRGLKADVHIGKNCFIGDRTIVLPGVTIPSNSVAVGNPARVIKSGIHCGKFGRISDY